MTWGEFSTRVSYLVDDIQDKESTAINSCTIAVGAHSERHLQSLIVALALQKANQEHSNNKGEDRDQEDPMSN